MRFELSIHSKTKYDDSSCILFSGQNIIYQHVHCYLHKHDNPIFAFARITLILNNIKKYKKNKYLGRDM